MCATCETTWNKKDCKLNFNNLVSTICKSASNQFEERRILLQSFPFSNLLTALWCFFYNWHKTRRQTRVKTADSSLQMTLMNLSQNSFWCSNYTPVTWLKRWFHSLSPFIKGQDRSKFWLQNTYGNWEFKPTNHVSKGNPT